VRDLAPPQLTGTLRKRAGDGYFERWVTRDFILRCGCLHWRHLPLMQAMHRSNGKPGAATFSESSFVNFSRTPCEVVEGDPNILIVRPLSNQTWCKEDRHPHIETSRPITLRIDDDEERVRWLRSLRAHVAYGWAGKTLGGHPTFLSNCGDSTIMAFSSSQGIPTSSASSSVKSVDFAGNNSGSETHVDNGALGSGSEAFVSPIPSSSACSSEKSAEFAHSSADDAHGENGSYDVVASEADEFVMDVRLSSKTKGFENALGKRCGAFAVCS